MSRPKEPRYPAIAWHKLPIALVLAAAATPSGCSQEHPVPVTVTPASPSGTAPPLGRNQVRLTLTIANHTVVPPLKPFDSVVVMNLPFDGKRLSTEMGAKLPIQTVINSTVTTAFRPTGLTLQASATPAHLDGRAAAVLELAIVDGHLIRQVEVPVKVSTSMPIRDVTACSGQWVFGNGESRVLYEWSASEGASIAFRDASWSVTAHVAWNLDPNTVLVRVLPSSLRADFALTFDGMGRVERHTATEDFLQIEDPQVRDGSAAADRAARSRHSGVVEVYSGHEVAIETIANNTSTFHYTLVRTGFRVEGSVVPSMPWTLSFFDERFAEFSDSDRRIPIIDGVTGTHTLSLAEDQGSPRLLTRYGDGLSGRSVTVNLDRFTVRHIGTK